MGQELEKTQPEQPPLERLERAQDQIREEYGDLLDEEAAHQQSPDQPAPQEDAAQPVKATEANQPPPPPADLKELLLGLRKLPAVHLLAVLQCLPAHHLARALAQMLTTKENLAVKQAEKEKAEAEAAAKEEAEANKRQAERAKSLRTGKIIYNNKSSVSDCQIRDISSTGCRIMLDSPASVPNYFTLHIINGDVRHECEVVWRKANTMGLMFLA